MEVHLHHRLPSFRGSVEVDRRKPGTPAQSLPRTLAHISRPNMAAVEQPATNSCAFCGRMFGAESARSQATHIGICRKKKQQRLASAAAPAPDASDTAPKRRRVAHEGSDADNPTQGRTVDAAPAPTPATADLVARELMPQLTSGDVGLLQFYLQREDVTSSLLSDVMALLHHASRPTLSSTAALFSLIDRQPGPLFTLKHLRLPNVGVQFVAAYRPLVDLAADMVESFNGNFVDPYVPGSLDQLPEFVHGQRYQQLHAKLQMQAGADAVLMPIVLSSDKTNLARFYLGAHSSKAHPVYMTLATLPTGVRQSQLGAKVAAFVPVYARHTMPPELTQDDHAANSKQLLWTTYGMLLEELIPERQDDAADKFVDGFRCA